MLLKLLHAYVLAHVHAPVYRFAINSAFRPCNQGAAAQALQEMTSVQQMVSLYSKQNLSTQICCSFQHLRKMAYVTPAVHFKACVLSVWWRVGYTVTKSLCMLHT